MNLAPAVMTHALDIVVLAVIALSVGASIRLGMFRKGRTSRLGAVLLVLGVAVTGLYYLVDVAFSGLIPGLADLFEPLSYDDNMKRDLHALSTVASLILIGIGLMVTALRGQEVETAMMSSERQMASAREAIVQSDIRFRSLLEQAPGAFYCVEFMPPIAIRLPLREQIEQMFRGRLVECNEVFASQTAEENAADALGMRVDQLLVKRSESTMNRLLRDFVENDYQLVDYDLSYRDKDDQPVATRVNFTGVVEHGYLLRWWGVEVDVLEQLQTKEALEYRYRFQEFVARLSASLVMISPDQFDEEMQKHLAETCEFLNTDRAGIVWLEPDNKTTSVRYVVNELGNSPRVDLSPQSFPWVAAQVMQGETVVIHSPDELPAGATIDARSLKTTGLASFVVIPMMVADRASGAFSFGDASGNRVWLDRDIADLRVLADLFANSIVRINARRSLNSALSELSAAKERLEVENIYLRQEMSSTHGFDEIIGESLALQASLRQVQRVAGTMTTVLIQGETGTGKELIARAIHEHSDRRDKPLVKVNCAALPAELIESELYGYEQGAFTGAIARKRGRFDLADEGTLFLDEIADLPLKLQGKLLRVLQEGEFQRLGGTKTLTVDVRLIAATNQSLLDAVDQGRFRADLYYRINTFPIHVPRLADREGDISLLAKHFVRKHAAQLGRDVTAISSTMLAQLENYDWPGNVRELEGIIQRALISASGPVLELPDYVEQFSTGRYSTEKAAGENGRVHIDGVPKIVDLQHAERSHIESALDLSRWVIGGEAGAAARLGIPPSTLRSKMKKLGIVRPS